MITFLLAVLVLMDIALIGAVVILVRRREIGNNDLVREIAEERRLLSEQQEQVKEELEGARIKSRELLGRLTQLATEAEQEVSSGRTVLASEIEKLVGKLALHFEEPLKEMAHRQSAMESLLRELDHKKALLQKMIGRGEKLTRFFDEKVPYDEVMQDLQDRKYTDARSLLARGMKPEAVALELGIPEREVRLICDVGTAG